MTIKNGSKVKVEYTGILEDGTVFDSSEKHGCALEFKIGSGQIIPGFESAVLEMNIGDEKQIKLEPKDAYGDNNPELVKKVPKKNLPPEAKAGMILGVGLPNGMQMPAKIVEMDDNEATIDFNHPLAGKTLNFKIKLIEVNSCEDKADCDCCSHK